MKNRSASEIIPAILECCIGGARITRIINRVQLSHSSARNYLSELLELGFVELDSDEGVVYSATEQGIRYFQRNRTLLELLTLC